MRLVIQRVTKASVAIQNEIVAGIERGLLVLLGIESADQNEDIIWLCNKLINLRIMNDEKGIMNKNVVDVHGDILVVSQFTLFAKTKKGNRPSYDRAAPASISQSIYQEFLRYLKSIFPNKVETGQFGAEMTIALENDGPVTLIMDSKNRE